MKLANIFWIIGLGWMILSFIEGFIFIINGLYFEDWSFSRPLFKIGFRMFQINVNSKIDMVRKQNHCYYYTIYLYRIRGGEIPAQYFFL